MTEPKGTSPSQRMERETADEMVSHKATRECPMIEPHRRAICGIVSARQRVRLEADAKRRKPPGS
jgi:hypothetical protein